MVTYHRKHGGLVTLFTHPNSHPYDSGLIIAKKNGEVDKWLAKEDERPKELTDEQKEENTIHWITFYRRNMNTYAERYLGIKLHPFQHMMLYLMSVSQVFFAICSRGLSKKL